MVQRYKFESKSQHSNAQAHVALCCFQWFKGTNLKANHNTADSVTLEFVAVSNGSKVQIWKQITTTNKYVALPVCCFQWFKGTNLKANHNNDLHCIAVIGAVSNGSKVQIWKQITTVYECSLRAGQLFPMVQRYKFESKSQRQYRRRELCNSCFQWFKGTNLKANHNRSVNGLKSVGAVSNGSKVQTWKQITTSRATQSSELGLFPIVQR